MRDTPEQAENVREQFLFHEESAGLTQEMKVLNEKENVHRTLLVGLTSVCLDDLRHLLRWSSV